MPIVCAVRLAPLRESSCWGGVHDRWRGPSPGRPGQSAGAWQALLAAARSETAAKVELVRRKRVTGAPARPPPSSLRDRPPSDPTPRVVLSTGADGDHGPGKYQNVGESQSAPGHEQICGLHSHRT
jgi:hypothetical protein